MFVGVTPTILRPLVALVAGPFWNPARKASSIVLSETGKRAVSTDNSDSRAVQTIEKITSGRYYAEVTILAPPSSSFQSFGFGTANAPVDATFVGGSNSIGYCSDGNVRVATSNADSAPTFTTGDVIGASVDLVTTADQATVRFFKNNVQVFSAAYGTAGFFSGDKFAMWSAGAAGADARLTAVFLPPSGFTRL